jgi:RimJ/RimL family protein N-acetyltransferase
MKFWPIQRDGSVDVPYAVPEVVKPVLATFTTMYQTVAFCPPWIGYLVSEGETPVGTCAFKRPPAEGRVEVAYFTYPEHEGKGVATRMVEELIRIAAAEDPRLIVAAQTLPEHGASTRILQKHGFVFWGSLHHPEDGLVWEWRRTAGSAG